MYFEKIKVLQVHETFEGTSKRTGNPYSVTEVEMDADGLGSVVVRIFKNQEELHALGIEEGAEGSGYISTYVDRHMRSDKTESLSNRAELTVNTWKVTKPGLK